MLFVFGAAGTLVAVGAAMGDTPQAVRIMVNAMPAASVVQRDRFM
jgi:hypothetical protein